MTQDGVLSSIKILRKTNKKKNTGRKKKLYCIFSLEMRFAL